MSDKADEELPIGADRRPKGRKRTFENRFNGLTETELKSRTLPDHLDHNLDIMIVGINPGYTAAFKGHHYAGPGNHFWKCLYLSKLIDKPLTALDDFRLIDPSNKYRIGFTNIVERTTRGSDCLTKDEIKTGAHVLKHKIKTYSPKIAVFNGKGIYEVFSGTTNFQLGLQPNSIDKTLIYVMPSSSARCSNLPRANDKLPFYMGLRELLDRIRDSKAIDCKQFIFGNLSSPKKAAKDLQSIYFERK